MLVIIGGPIRASHLDRETNFLLASGTGSVKTIGDIVFALGFTPAALPAYTAMKDKRLKTFSNTVKVSVVVGAMMCCITGLTGYLAFTDGTQANILSNFNTPVGAVFKLGVVVHLLFYIPGDFVIFRLAFFKLFGKEVATTSDFVYVSTTVAMFCIVTTVAIILQLADGDGSIFGVVVNFTGGKIFEFQNISHDPRLKIIKIKNRCSWFDDVFCYTRFAGSKSI